MGNVLGQCILADGKSLIIERYFLSQNDAKALQRPVGSPELLLRLLSEGSSLGTNPKASWFLPESAYWRLYDGIENEAGFRKVVEFCGQVNSAEDAAKVESLLDML